MTLFKNSKVNDTLAQKEARLAILNEESDAALQLVRNTIDGLQAVDQEICTTISEIEDMQERMSRTKAGLESRRNKNQQIMHNFKSLLCEE